MIYCIRFKNYKVLTMAACKSLSFEVEAGEKHNFLFIKKDKTLILSAKKKGIFLINIKWKC